MIFTVILPVILTVILPVAFAVDLAVLFAATCTRPRQLHCSSRRPRWSAP
ncbi:hypothetical protein [Streptomyces koelreuteriae]